jgi:holo-[acyl-carrier protein] synthase
MIIRVASQFKDRITLTDESPTLLGTRFGLGIDIVEIRRFRELDVDASFFSRTFTRDELTYCYSYSDPAPHLAVTFAGKEAVVKAMSNLRQLPIARVEILRNESKAPYVRIEEKIATEVLVSLSHSEQNAVAVALVIPKSHSNNVKLFRKLLNENIQELLPGSE